MVSSPVDEWHPVFPEPAPAHWVALVEEREGVAAYSDLELSAEECNWLAVWLSRYRIPEPEAEASYVYLGLAAGWSSGAADGHVSARAVTGVGSGEGFGAPPQARTSTVAGILCAAAQRLSRGD